MRACDRGPYRQPPGHRYRSTPTSSRQRAEHTEWLLQQDPFPSHPHIGKDDKTLPERIKAANYAFDFTDAENVSHGSTGPKIKATIDAAHQGLFVGSFENQE